MILKKPKHNCTIASAFGVSNQNYSTSVRKQNIIISILFSEILLNIRFGAFYLMLCSKIKHIESLKRGEKNNQQQKTYYY
ncbi:hypothetical protein HQ39_08370 [Porphyromonas sp. COT-108 OH2963]|nr:hypothetical protein HQ39_08370 [Porphyromonas sp. COT-108 OH2963]